MIEIYFGNLGIIFELISVVIMIISYILIIVQAFDNYNFKNCKKKELIAERVLYEQFSNEIYSNLNSYPFSNLTNGYYENGYELKIEEKIYSFYDCQDIYDDELNEKICQNKIISNITCCRHECCSRTNGGRIFCNDYNFNLNTVPNNKELLYNDEEILEDPRRRYCTYFNLFTKEINYYELPVSFINLGKFIYNYKDLLLNNIDNVCIGKSNCLPIDCGIIDSKDNHLYVSDRKFCPVNNIEIERDSSSSNLNSISYNRDSSNKKIVIRNILSEIPPNLHEWKELKVELKENNEQEKENYLTLNGRYLETTIKEINKIAENNENLYQKIDGYLKPQELYFNSNLNKNQEIYWYTTNYIGFGSKDDLIKFIGFFDENDYTNNLLYRYGEEIYPELESIIIGFVLILLCIVYIILFSLKKFLTILFIIKQIIFIITLGLEIGIYSWKTIVFKKIEIDIDDNYKHILNLYNKRRFQLLFLLGIIILFLSEIFSILMIIINKFVLKKNGGYILIKTENNNINNEREDEKEDEKEDKKEDNNEKVIPYKDTKNDNQIRNSENANLIETEKRGINSINTEINARSTIKIMKKNN